MTIPQNTTAERAILGGVFLAAAPVLAQVHAAGLTPSDFYDPANRAILSAFLAIDATGQPVDIVTVSTALNDSGDLQRVGGFPYLSALSGDVPTVAGIGSYIEAVQDSALRRRLLVAAEASVERLRTGGASGAEELEVAESGLSALRTRGSAVAVEAVGPIAERVYADVLDRSKNPGVAGLETGFPDLDRLTGGLRPGDLRIIAGRPSMGKSAFALNVMTHLGLRLGVSSVFFSLEMPREQHVARMLSSEARVGARRIRDADMRDDDWGPLLAATETLANAPIYFDDRPAVTVGYVRSVVQRLHGRSPLGAVFVDYLQLMRGDREARREGRQHEIASISMGLKALAKEFGLPVIALSQLNRSVEQRVDKRPVMSDLRESGAIEQDADVIMFLYRDEYYNPDNPATKGLAEVLIRKAREGETGSVDLAFRGEFTRFQNLEKDWRDTPTTGGHAGRWGDDDDE